MALIGFGGFRDEISISESKLMHIPDDMNFEMAAGFTMNYGTTIHALRDRANLQPGETLLVLGAAGGVGISAITIGKAMGANVIAVASSQEKLNECKKMGADQFVNYSKGPKDFRSQLKSIAPMGVDVVYDPVGGDYAEQAIRGLAWKGRYLVIGFAAGTIPKIPLNLALLKGASIVGVFWGAFTTMEPDLNQKNLDDLMKWFKTGKLRGPPIQVYKGLDNCVHALNALAGRKSFGPFE